VWLMLRIEVFATTGFSWIEKVFEAVPTLALMSTVTPLPTDETVALNPVVDLPAETVTADGTLTAALLLESVTFTLLVVAVAR